MTAPANLLEWEEPSRDPGAPRPHCRQCGRFTTHLASSERGPDITGEYPDTMGVCRVHGTVYESWPL